MNQDMSYEDKCISLEYIKIQWADIHHMHQQEIELIIAIGIIAFTFTYTHGLHGIRDIGDIPDELLGLAGIIISLASAIISLQNYFVFNAKIKIITELEGELGFEFGYKSRFNTQLILYILFIGFVSIFSSIFAESLSRHFPLIEHANVYFGIGIFLFFTLLAFLLAKFRKNQGIYL